MGGKRVVETAVINMVQPPGLHLGDLLLGKIRELQSAESGDWRVGTMTTTLLHADRVLILVVFERWA